MQPHAASEGPKAGSEDRWTFTVEEMGARLGLSRAAAYAAVKNKEIPSIRIGRRVLIPRAALERLVGGT